MKHDVYDSGATATKIDNRTAQGHPSAARLSEQDQQEMMKRMQAAGTPGAGHKALEHFVGNWKGEVKCWMEPGAPPMVSQATSKVEWTLGGRFTKEEFHGEMMGKPFTGCCIMGYDNTKQMFNSVWMDDMNTAMFISEGRGDEKVITLEGKANCAATGRKDVPMKVVFRVLSPDKHTFEMFDGSKGENARTMEITYTRQ